MTAVKPQPPLTDDEIAAFRKILADKEWVDGLKKRLSSRLESAEKAISASEKIISVLFRIAVVLVVLFYGGIDFIKNALGLNK